MASSRPKSEAEVQATKRRQEYWKRRRAVEKARARPHLTAAQYEDTAELWREAMTDIDWLVDELSGLSSPRMFEAARRAQERFGEIRTRGTQMSLLGDV